MAIHHGNMSHISRKICVDDYYFLRYFYLIITIRNFKTNNMKKLIILFSVILVSCRPKNGFEMAYSCYKSDIEEGLKDYQIKITDQDHALLYDGNKLVGRFKFTNTELDSLIKKDNL